MLARMGLGRSLGVWPFPLKFSACLSGSPIPTPGHSPKRNDGACSQKDSLGGARGSFAYSGQDGAQPQMPTNREGGEQIVVPPHDGQSLWMRDGGGQAR